MGRFFPESVKGILDTGYNIPSASYHPDQNLRLRYSIEKSYQNIKQFLEVARHSTDSHTMLEATQGLRLETSIFVGLKRRYLAKVS